MESLQFIAEDLPSNIKTSELTPTFCDDATRCELTMLPNWNAVSGDGRAVSAMHLEALPNPDSGAVSRECGSWQPCPNPAVGACSGPAHALRTEHQGKGP
jgi:hypothetical protein